MKKLTTSVSEEMANYEIKRYKPILCALKKKQARHHNTCFNHSAYINNTFVLIVVLNGLLALSLIEISAFF